MVDVALGERGHEAGASATTSQAALVPAAAVELTEEDLFESLRGELHRLQVRKCPDAKNNDASSWHLAIRLRIARRPAAFSGVSALARPRLDDLRRGCTNVDRLVIWRVAQRKAR
jgi:hypothetical protein